MHNPNENIEMLKAQRRELLRHLKRLKKASAVWNVDERRRGEATRANLLAQLYELDRLLEHAVDLAGKQPGQPLVEGIAA